MPQGDAGYLNVYTPKDFVIGQKYTYERHEVPSISSCNRNSVSRTVMELAYAVTFVRIQVDTNLAWCYA